MDYYTNNNDCKWSEGDDKKYFDSFCTYSQKASYVFIYLQNTEDDGFLWQRAVLTKGNYLIPASYNRLNFLTISLSERYYSWKRLLRLNNIHESDDPLLTLKRQYVKAVFDDSRFSISDFENSCRKIISDSANDWRSFFIQNPELISVCLKGFIRFDDELNIMLLKTSKLTYHYELIS